MPKITKGHEVFFFFFSDFIQNLFRSSFKALASIVIPPAYEVCQGVYSFRLSVSPSVRPWSVRMLTFCVKVLREVFFLLYIFLKAYTLGC